MLFDGWFEDVTCTQPFKFNITMPNANKMIYARWVPERYRITIDADGGEMPLGSTFSTYFNTNYNELVDEYSAIRRDYIENENGDYVYFDFSYEKLLAFSATPEGSHLLDEDGKFEFPGALRKAFYIRASDVYSFFTNGNNSTVGGTSYSYKDFFTDYNQFITFSNWVRYEKVPDGSQEFQLYAWYRVNDDGNTEATPYDFRTPVSEDIKLRAKWNRVGKYSFTYNPTMTATGITGEMPRYNDPLESDRKYVDGAAAVVLPEPTNLKIDQMINPDDPASSSANPIDPNEYVFRGWRVVDGEDRTPLEDNVFYNAGDTIYVDARWADSAHVIHMEAYYERKESAIRRVDYATLTLYANLPNTNNGGVVNRAGLANDKFEYANLTDNSLVLDRQLNNFAINLADYRKNFTNTNGYMLIGWDEDPDHSPGDYIPDYYADAIIGANKENPLPNVLYAVWEPMVYITLNNATENALTFDLSFSNYTGIVYEDMANSANDTYSRKKFSDESYVTENSQGNFTVTLQAGQQVKLVVPEAAGANYTVSGNYTTNSSSSNLIVYNSGADRGVTIKKESNGKWYRTDNATSGPYNTGDEIPYSTSGALIEGEQGRLVMFTQTEPYTTLYLSTLYYDTDDGTWKDTTPDDANAVANFSLEGTGSSQEVSGEGYSASVKLINNNETVRFGVKVNSYNSTDYKFIGWYTTPFAAPNAPSIDGHKTDAGATTVGNLTVPQESTHYYALFVPYAAGDLKVTHSQKADSAGKCASPDGLKLNVAYNGETSADLYGDSTNPLSKTIAGISERTPDATIDITVGAKVGDYGSYYATYQNDTIIPSDQITDNTGTTGYHEYSHQFTVSDLLTGSDTVKGLMTLRDVDFYSAFLLGYEITYRYTARDGKLKDYVERGNMDSYDEVDFKEFVIEHTPYTRTLTGDTIWNTNNIRINKMENGVVALLEEIPNVRGFCTVTINNADKSVSYEKVEYGKTFSIEQAERNIADESITENGVKKLFDHWEIINTTTKAHISDNYNREFHFAVWNNYTITPVYMVKPTVDPTPQWQFVTIDYIDSSRNQWNKVNEQVSENVTDKVVADLDIAFNDGTNLILNTFDAQGNYAYKLGVIFEIAGTTEDGTITSSSYSSEGSESAVKSRVQEVLAKPKDSGGSVASGYYYTRININEDTVSTFNRSEFARSFNTANVADKVLRVYAYMVLPGNNSNGSVSADDIIISDPYYKTLYDVAHQTYVVD